MEKGVHVERGTDALSHEVDQNFGDLHFLRTMLLDAGRILQVHIDWNQRGVYGLCIRDLSARTLCRRQTRGDGSINDPEAQLLKPFPATAEDEADPEVPPSDELCHETYAKARGRSCKGADLKGRHHIMPAKQDISYAYQFG